MDVKFAVDNQTMECWLKFKLNKKYLCPNFIGQRKKMVTHKIQAMQKWITNIRIE